MIHLKNLLKNKGNKTINGIEWTFNYQGLISIKGTIVNDFSDYYFLGENVENAEAFTTHVDLVLSSNYITNDNNCVFGARTDAGLLQNHGKFNSVSIPSGTRIYGVFMRVLNKTVDYSGIYAQLEPGSTATPYEPYTGDTYNIALPETVYGGEVNAVSVEGQETWKTIDLANAKISLYGINQHGIANFSLLTKNNNIHTTTGVTDYFTSSLPKDNSNFNNATKIGIYKANESTFYIRLKETDAKNEAKAKAYLASINAKLVYKLAEPVPFTATGTQPIPALNGVNTIYTDADSVVVTGAEDPKHTITELKNAIISLGGNI